MNGEQVFHRTIGGIIANLISVDYNGWLAVEFREMGNKYLANKCLEAQKAEQKVIDRLKVINPEVKAMIEKRAKTYSDLVFDITAMDDDKQRRILNLIAKIKKEESLKQ